MTSGRKTIAFLLLSWIVPSVAGCSMNAYPYGPRSATYLDVSPDGKYLGAVSQDGELKVYHLESREVVFRQPKARTRGFPQTTGTRFVGFRGLTESVLWDCRDGTVCLYNLATSKEDVLLEHDPQDNIRAGISSDDGQRMVFGTRGGRLFTFDFQTGQQETLKERDVWSRGGGSPIYTLEGTVDLERFVSATSTIAPIPDRLLADGPRAPGTIEGPWVHRRLRFQDGRIETRKELRFSGITVWTWEGATASEIRDGFADKIRADFSPDGTELLVREEGWPKFGGYSTNPIERQWSFKGTVNPSCDGLRFLEPKGEYFGSVSYDGKFLETFQIKDIPAEQLALAKLRLKNKPAGGRRVMVVHPEKGWVFIGLAKGGVDWYEFRPEPGPSLKHISTLK